MQARLSLSLGAVTPRPPSTCRGTMVKVAAAAPDSTKVRRVTVPAMVRPFRGCSGGPGHALRPEEQGKEHEDHEGADGGHLPDRRPVMAVAHAVRAGDAPGDEGADEVAHAVGDEVDQPLRRGADLRPRLLVGVDLARDEEEVVADAVQQDAGIDEPHACAGVTRAEGEVPERPGEHAD